MALASAAVSASEVATALLKSKDFFNVRRLVSVRDLFKARVHYGHKEGSLNRHMVPYLFGSRLGVTIFDLDKTVHLLRDALNFIAHISYRDGIILFTNSNRQTAHLVEKMAKECGQYSHCREFNSHILCNSDVYYGAVTRLPDLCVLFTTQDNVFQEHLAVKDSARMLIPTVGIVDSNSDPTLVTYPIPGNDDTPASVELYCRLFKEAVLAGKSKRQEMLNRFATVPM